MAPPSPGPPSPPLPKAATPTPPPQAGPSTPPSAKSGAPSSATPTRPSSPPPKRFSLDLRLLRRPFSPSPHRGHTDDERPIGHQARVLYALITGSIPATAPERQKTRMPSLPPFAAGGAIQRGTQSRGPTRGVLTHSSVVQPELQPTQAQGVRTRQGLEPEEEAHGTKGHECRAVPHVKPKALGKLKADLVNADKARAIVADLHRMEVPLEEAQGGETGDEVTALLEQDSSLGAASSKGNEGAMRSAQRTVVRGYALAPLEEPAPTSAAHSAVDASASPGVAQPTLVTFGASLPPTSPGALGGLAGAKSGAFGLLADLSGALVQKSGAHEGLLVVPQDRVTVLVYWWGFEIALPPSTIRTLSSVASVQSSFFTFLQAFTLAGGAPELAPFVRYISSYCDMEWQAIKAQNRGKGVVLAATWLLPVALVPRPWDLPLRPPPSTPLGGSA